MCTNSTRSGGRHSSTVRTIGPATVRRPPRAKQGRPRPPGGDRAADAVGAAGESGSGAVGSTDAGLAQLEGLKKLKSLYVWQTKVTDAGVEKLKKALPQLQIIRGIEEPKPMKTS